MSLTFFQLAQLCEQINPLLEGTALISFESQEDYKFVLSFQTKSKVLHLLLCFRTPFLRFHLVEDKPEVAATPFTNQIYSKINGAILRSMKILHEDRILQMTFRHGESVYHLVGEFFSKSPNLYFLTESNDILSALHPVTAQIYQLPVKPIWPEKQRTAEEPITSLQIDQHYALLEEKALFQREKTLLQGQVRRRLKGSQQHLEKFQQELSAAENWEIVQHEALLLQANMFRLKRGMKEVSVQDWKNEGADKVISLDPGCTPQDELIKRFRISKKLRASIPHVKKRIEIAEQKKDWWVRQSTLLEGLTNLTDLERFRAETKLIEKTPASKKAKPTEKKSLPYYEYTTETGLKIWVGKRAKDNEKLTFSIARGNDWWLHASGFPGSHVVLRASKNQEPDRESLLDAMQLALIHSKAKMKGEAEIVVTQRKYVSPFGKGHAGKVQISQHKTVFVRIDQTRFERLKERKSQE